MRIRYNFAFKDSKLSPWQRPAPPNILVSDASLNKKIIFLYQEFHKNSQTNSKSARKRSAPNRPRRRCTSPSKCAQARGRDRGDVFRSHAAKVDVGNVIAGD